MVRRFNLTDILLVKRLQGRGGYLDLETALLWSPAPLTMALLEYLSLNAAHISTFVEDESSTEARGEGFLQAWDRADGLGCDVVCIAPSLRESPGISRLWYDLLEHLVRVKGERGVQRIFVKLAEGEPGIEVFRQIGFNRYTRRQVYRLAQLPTDLEPADRKLLRRLKEGDEPRLQRLHSALTPRPVQQAEGSATAERDFVGSLPWWKNRRVEEYVLADGDEIQAHLRVVGGEEGHWVNLTAKPEAHRQGDQLLSESLSTLSGYPPRPLYCGIRDYEAGLRGSLEALGFEPIASELLMVKHTAVRARLPVEKLSPALEKGVETATPISTSNSCEEVV